LKKFIVLILLIAITNPLFAQKGKYKRTYHEYYDSRPLHFGFLFGLAGSNYNYISTNNHLDEILSPKYFGFQIGGIVNYALNQHIELKSGINVALFERHINYNTSVVTLTNPFNDKIETKNLNFFRESTWLEIPVVVKLRSLRRKNNRFFMVAGIKFGVESNSREADNRPNSPDPNSTEYNHTIFAKKADLTLEYGLGFEHFFQFFKFSPEIRFSHGIFNMYQSPTTSDPVADKLRQITQLNTHTVSLILNFE
jgi:hypothetical protein